MRHFFPQLNAWLDRLPDTRDRDQIVYPGRFLVWWGLLLYVLQLGSRRNLDYDLRAEGTQVLANVNRLAETQQETRPVHDTLDHFLEHTTVAGLAGLRSQMVQRLVRMKVLDDARVLGYVVMISDGTGHLHFGKRHCAQCLRQRHGTKNVYRHDVLEAKLVGPADVVFSVGSAFIENEPGWEQLPEDERKQNCELKAMDQLAPEVKHDFPQLKICWVGDALFCCGRGFALARQQRWAFIFTFKEGRLPSLWKEFQELLRFVPEQRVIKTLPDKTLQEYRWVNDLDYVDSEGRAWKLNALQCVETKPKSQPTTWAWLTQLRLNQNTVFEVAQKGGRVRWLEENQGFNRQKNSGMNMQHVYSTDPQKLKAYYLLLQIAHLLLLLMEKGSLLRCLVEAWNSTVLKWYGSLKKLAQRLLDSLRRWAWPADSFTRSAKRVRLDNSS